MRRTQIYLAERQVAELRAAARAERRTVSEIVREAIDDRLQREPGDDAFKRGLAESFGIWRDRDDLGSTDEFVRRIRRDRRSRPRV